MFRILRLSFLCVVIAVTLLSNDFTHAQTSKEATPAPLPSQFETAKKIFVANAGQEFNPNAGKFGKYSGGDNRAYNQFYSALKNWGRYELVSSPADCDLVLEVEFTDGLALGRVFKGDSIEPIDNPLFRLSILDPKSHIMLWAFTEHVAAAQLQGNRDKNFDDALTKIVDDVKNLIGQSSMAPK